jgi:hypothetical protein
MNENCKTYLVEHTNLNILLNRSLFNVYPLLSIDLIDLTEKILKTSDLKKSGKFILLSKNNVLYYIRTYLMYHSIS